MKIRIKGNSVRYRLSKSEVAKLEVGGYLEEQTSFGEHKLRYALQVTGAQETLSASFIDGKITLFIPESHIRGWAQNETVGFNATMPLTGTDSLYLLVEKDFICLDETTEDQNDNYENPNKTC
jgi:hypothetical protein